ncbi:MAG: MFS transporter [Candidatus Micrarchaeia archaeon]
MGLYISDKFGRKLAFMMMILVYVVYAFGSLITAFVTNFSQLIGARSFGAFGTGGDAPTGNAIVAEEARPEKRSLVLIILAVGNVVGFAVGTGIVLLFLYLHIYFMYAFIVGFTPAILVFFIRRYIDETSRYKDLKKGLKEVSEGKEIKTEFKHDISQAKRNPYIQLFSKGFRLTSVLVAIFTTIVAGIVAVSLIYFTIYFIDVKHLPLVTTVSFEFISYALAGIGYVYTGLVGNRIGRKNIILINLVVAGLLMICVLFSFVPSVLLIFYVLFITFHYSQWAAWPFYVAETYPTRMRGTASNYAYAFQWVGNVVFPTALLGLLTVTGFNWGLSLTAIVIIPLFVALAIVYPLKKSSPTAELEENAI